MKGNSTKAWLWWIVIVGANWIFFLTVRGYETVNFTTVHAKGETYSEFVQRLRDKLASGETSHGIPLLPSASTVPDSERYILVQLTNWPNASITLALDVTNLYIVAYRSGNNSYFLGDNIPSLFYGTLTQALPIGNTYPQLEKFAGPRAKIELGIMALEEAISRLVVDNATSYEQNTTAKSLIVVNQMVCEAARFRNIEQKVRWSIRSNQRFRPDTGILSLENQWKAISTEIQASRQGAFRSPVQLQRSNRSYLKEDAVTDQLVSNIALMLVTCRSQSNALVTARDGDNAFCANRLEPTVQIPGPNGLCMDVHLARYNDGNEVQLYGCKDNTGVNQLWTLKTDGTIRSNGKCLTALGFTPGSNAVIYNCTIASYNATQWQIWENGTITNPQSGLVLTAKSPKSGVLLTLEANIYATSQAWVATNNSKPIVTTIVGFRDLCLQANGDSAWIIECESNEKRQKWAIYADGSIRPVTKQGSCLSSHGDVEGSSVGISACNGSSGQRWMFRNDGSILNLYNGMVMDVVKSDPALEKIIIWPSSGSPNQKWLPVLL